MQGSGPDLGLAIAQIDQVQLPPSENVQLPPSANVQEPPSANVQEPPSVNVQLPPSQEKADMVVLLSPLGGDRTSRPVSGPRRRLRMQRVAENPSGMEFGHKFGHALQRKLSCS